MGLDAYVHCRCWQDGLTPPPPAEPVGFDAEGALGLQLPVEGHEAEHDAVDLWLVDACRHELMEYAREPIASWGGVRLLQQSLEPLASSFPVLSAHLPRANGGSIPAADADAILAELDAFEAMPQVGQRTALVEEPTGEELMTYIAAYDGVRILNRQYRAGVDPFGFFVLDTDTDPPTTLFRSARFRQRAIAPELVEFIGDGNPVRVPIPPIQRDGAHRSGSPGVLDGGLHGGSHGGLRGGLHGGPPPERLVVRTTPLSGDHFGYIIGPLRRICLASVAIGNPVVWS